MGLQNLAVAGGLSTEGTAVGGAIIVNILNDVLTQAFIDSGDSVTHVDSAKAMTISATASINPIVPDPKITKIKFPAVSNVAVRGSAGGGGAPGTGTILPRG